ncbi:MAG: NTP/NDP exchange transporter [Novosphingobium sp.]
MTSGLLSGEPADAERRIAGGTAEASATIGGFLFLFLLFASYFMLRPVRETFAVAGGVDNLPWLYVGTFLGALAVVPAYGWLTARVPRARLVPVSYLFSAVVMFGFAAQLAADPDNVWTGRAFYIWVSTFNMFVISIAWSLMSDVFSPDQARRLFGRIAAGASLGGLTGPILSGLLVERVGHAGLLAISTLLLLATLGCVQYLLRWQRLHANDVYAGSAGRPLEGGIWAGLTTILRSRHLLGICAFIVLLTMVSTFLYFEQARLVKATFADKTEQTQVFAAIDAAVQATTIFIQVFVTGLVARRLGLAALLAIVPVLCIVGFGALAVVATFPVLAAVMFVRRVGEYALIRPGREMLFTTLSAETRYKSKNAVDTVIYRGGDMLSAWLNTAIVAVGSTGAAALVGGIIAAVWAVAGLAIGRKYDRDRASTAGS